MLDGESSTTKTDDIRDSSLYTPFAPVFPGRPKRVLTKARAVFGMLARSGSHFSIPCRCINAADSFLRALFSLTLPRRSFPLDSEMLC